MFDVYIFHLSSIILQIIDMDIRKRELFLRMTHNENGERGESAVLLPSEIPVGFVNFPMVRSRKLNRLNGSLNKNEETGAASTFK